jgi:hypothetical protein
MAASLPQCLPSPALCSFASGSGSTSTTTSRTHALHSFLRFFDARNEGRRPNSRLQPSAAGAILSRRG